MYTNTNTKHVTRQGNIDKVRQFPISNVNIDIDTRDVGNTDIDVKIKPNTN